MTNDHGFTHLNQAGEVHMVDVGDKAATKRVATADGLVRMSPELISRFFDGGLDKGDAAAVARVAGITGAKRTSDLIPLCHPIPLSGIEVTLEPATHGVRITATVSTTGQTGVEMEAMTAVSTAALTVYDMVKSVERDVTIDTIRLVHKAGGRSGEWVRAEVVD
ncbi:MAG: cyclic pyranopterin monophosphate synthase MoaC [Acidimicrobiia bacterium]